MALNKNPIGTGISTAVKNLTWSKGLRTGLTSGDVDVAADYTKQPFVEAFIDFDHGCHSLIFRL